MAVCEIHLNAQPALEKMTSLSVILPENAGPGPFPVLYLLHGLSDNHTAWTRRTNLERYIENCPLIVVMPDGGRNWYTDSCTEPKSAYETFIVRDLIEFVDRTFRTRPVREGRAIAGLSMGGYGAIKLALKYPELYVAAVSHSGALRRPHETENKYLGSERHRIFGEAPNGGPNDIYALAEAGAQTPRPKLWIDCGTEDSLLEENRKFHQHLTQLRIAHEYHENPGGHDWRFWDKYIQESLIFISSVFGINKA